MSEYEQMTPDGFAKAFEKNMNMCRTYKECYELAEENHEKNYGTRRYSGYDSFRQVRYRKIKKGNKVYR